MFVNFVSNCFEQTIMWHGVKQDLYIDRKGRRSWRDSFFRNFNQVLRAAEEEFLFLLLAVAAIAQRDRPSRVKADDPPAPYSFVYGSSAKDGSHGREETRDEHGTVRGSYRIALADGRMRLVKYVADKDGFRAGISTNEQGTESASSSGVVVHSEALPGPDAARAEARKARARSAARAAASRPAAAASYNVERRVAPAHARMPGYLPVPSGEGAYFEP